MLKVWLANGTQKQQIIAKNLTWNKAMDLIQILKKASGYSKNYIIGR